MTNGEVNKIHNDAMGNAAPDSIVDWAREMYRLIFVRDSEKSEKPNFECVENVQASGPLAALLRPYHGCPRGSMGPAVGLSAVELLRNAKEKYLIKGPDDTFVCVTTWDYDAILGVLEGQEEAEKNDPRYAERLRVFNDPWTGRLMTTCSNCQEKVGPHDRFCKHCGREFKEAGNDG